MWDLQRIEWAIPDRSLSAGFCANVGGSKRLPYVTDDNGEYGRGSDWNVLGDRRVFAPIIGAIFRLTDASNVYVDLERTNGGEVVENWWWNVGFRTEF